MPTRLLNRLLPRGVKTFLREMAAGTIPSMRHLDMPRRLAHMKKVGFSPAVILDVGAASGEWTKLAARIWPDARIIGFEPNEQEREKLEEVRRLIPGFSFHRAFLGPRRDTIDYTDKGPETSVMARSGEATAKADMLVLDEMISDGQIPAPDLIKADVQGFELEFLKGATKALEGAQAVLLEVNFFPYHPAVPIIDEVIAFMRAAGYVWYDTMGLIRRAQDDALFQMDVMFLKVDHPLSKDTSWGGQA